MGLGDSTTFDGQLIMAIQDMNNDKLVDLVTLNTERNEVTVNYFDGLNYSQTAQFKVSGLVESVVPTKS